MNQVTAKPAFKIIGTRPVRPDGVDKVTGKAAYGADLVMPGMLFGAILRSPHAHARIVSIDTRKARALPGVKAVATGADFPDLDEAQLGSGEASLSIADIGKNCMARGKALYEGHAVAAVAAMSKAIAEEAVRLIEVVYEPLPHVIDVEAAMAPDAPLLHEAMFTKGLETRPDRPSNIAKFLRLPKGDARAAIEAAEVVVEGRFTAPPVHQGYIEPHACVVSVGADGQAQIWASSQGQFMVRSLTAAITGMKLADIRVTPAEIGGGFGGKTTVYLEPVAVVLSRKSGRPVKMVMSRDEVFRGSGPAPGGVVNVRLGATRDGRIVGAEVELKYQAGAFPGSSVQAGAITALACYDIANYDIKGWDVVCNMPNVAAYRAPAANPAQFAVESAIDDLARMLGMDPIEIREKNAVRDGLYSPYGLLYQNIGFEETLAALKAHPHLAQPLGPNQGRGVAAGFWVNHGGEATVMISISEDGGAVVAYGSPDIGGSRASMAMMAAEVLGLPIEQVRAVVADTASIGFSMLTGGSSTTYRVGMAIANAANDLVIQMKARAALTWGVDADQVGWRDGQAVCLAPDRDEPPLSIAEIAAAASRTGGPLSAESVVDAHGAAPTFGVHACDVEVDPETGRVTVLRYTAAQDVGRAIHPAYVEGQIQGGAAQGIGWALNEEYVFDAAGRVENPGFLDYRMPVASDLPMIDTIMVESVPNPHHPFGVKGVGETPIVPPLAAVANAVRSAVGKRFYDLPMSPSRVYAALHAGD
ncbi:xanthine dehydrogenase family protein molybdopterin-binding subunit [Phenylobacterium sp. LjRoot225]|uniref:xanthine dehydrogenase family protein molybdopterin-binding subunit n=1 Tax=Phenylobacterium sp. LjRoot225 TaxID=3342285 RepID=UPI003ECFFD24